MVQRYDFYQDGLSYGCYCGVEESEDGDYVKFDDYAALLESHRELIEHAKKLIELTNILQSNGGIIGWTSDHIIDDATEAIARAEGIG